MGSIPELELMANSRIGIDYLNKNGIDKFGIEVSYKNILIHKLIEFFNSEIFLPWESYLEYILLGVSTRSTYS